VGITTRLLLLLTLLLFMSGCERDLDRPIRIVLPNDYRGEFSIVKDQKGTPFTKTAAYYTFTIPASGELRTPNISPFFRFHQLRVEFADGRVLVDYSKHIFTGQGLKVEDKGCESGQIQTGPSSWKGSTDYDGTKMRWAVGDAH
jgi:hypothetical protein